MNGLSIPEDPKIFRNSEDFIKAYCDKEKELGVEPPLRTGYHNDRGYEYEIV